MATQNTTAAATAAPAAPKGSQAAKPLPDYKAMPKRAIKRHTLQTRVTHGIVMASCLWLMISGLFVFIPPLANAVPDIAQGMRISHRVAGCLLLLVPLVSAIMAPKGVKAIWDKYITSWTKEDVEFVVKFVPYMLGPKRVHMPDQDEVKSGQRIADGMLIIGAFIMIVTGLILWLGTSVFRAGPDVLAVARFLHDLFFLVMVIFVVAHAYLGLGVFQPYRGTWRVMFGDGQIDESSALYHWGFWAREEIEDGKNVVPDAKAARK